MFAVEVLVLLEPVVEVQQLSVVLVLVLKSEPINFFVSEVEPELEVVELELPV